MKQDEFIGTIYVSQTRGSEIYSFEYDEDWLKTGKSILLSEEGWILSPMYDVNPDCYGKYLSLNVNQYDSRIDLDLAADTAQYYGTERENADQIISDISGT